MTSDVTSGHVECARVCYQLAVNRGEVDGDAPALKMYNLVVVDDADADSTARARARKDNSSKKRKDRHVSKGLWSW